MGAGGGGESEVGGAMISAGERTFLFYLTTLAPDLPPPEQEYRFHSVRRWRFDFCWPTSKLAVEVEGGTWVRGRHVRGTGYEGDCEKYNAAVLGGWRVLRFTPAMLKQDPSGCIETVRRTYNQEDEEDETEPQGTTAP